MKRKISAIILTLLIIISAITITTNNYTVKAATQKPNLYVGGGGPSNYTKIQYALENASSGNTTIFVYTGTYSETLIINKTVNITGEDTSSTIIDAENSGCAVVITADLYGFRFFDCDSKSWKKPDGHIDFWNLWDDETKAYDGLWYTKAGCTRNLTDNYPYGNPYKGWFWTPFIELTLDNPIKCDGSRTLFFIKID